MSTGDWLTVVIVVGFVVFLGVSLVLSVVWDWVISEKASRLRSHGRHVEALRQVERLIARTERRLGLDAPELVDMLVFCGTYRAEVGDLPGGRAALKRAVTLQEKQHRGDHPEVASILITLGGKEIDGRDLVNAEPPLLRAAGILGVRQPGPPSAASSLCLFEFGRLESAQGKYQEALRSFAGALDRLPGERVERKPEEVVIRQARAWTLWSMGLPRDAQEELAPLAAWSGGEAARALALHGRSTLAQVELARGSFEQARKRFEMSLREQEALFGAHSEQVAWTFLHRAYLNGYTGRWEEAEAGFREGRRLLEEVAGAPGAASGRQPHAEFLAAVGRTQEAGRLLLEAVALAPSHDSPGEDGLFARLRLALASHQASYASFDEGITAMQTCIAAEEARLGEGHPDVLRARLELASFWLSVDRPDTARGILARDLPRLEACVGEESLDLAQPYRDMGNLARDDEHDEEAKRWLERSVLVVSKQLTEAVPFGWTYRVALAHWQAEHGELESATRICETAAAVITGALGPWAPQLLECHRLRVLLRKAAGDVPAAREAALVGRELLARVCSTDGSMLRNWDRRIGELLVS